VGLPKFVYNWLPRQWRFIVFLSAISTAITIIILSAFDLSDIGLLTCLLTNLLTIVCILSKFMYDYFTFEPRAPVRQILPPRVVYTHNVDDYVTDGVLDAINAYIWLKGRDSELVATLTQEHKRAITNLAIVHAYTTLRSEKVIRTRADLIVAARSATREVREFTGLRAIKPSLIRHLVNRLSILGLDDVTLLEHSTHMSFTKGV
jgi:hypothetical protein